MERKIDSIETNTNNSPANDKSDLGPTDSSRRSFIKTSSAIVAGGSFLISGTKASGNIIGANDRVRIAVAGLNGRGGAHIGGWKGQKNVEIVALVDPDKKVLANRMKSVEGAKGFADVRKV